MVGIKHHTQTAQPDDPAYDVSADEWNEAHDAGTIADVLTDHDLAAHTALGLAVFTTGMIMLWSGTIATIPTGWALCNGAGGTPDLRDKFVVGARQDDAGTAKTNLTGALTQSGGSISHSHSNHSLTQPTIANHVVTQPVVANHVVTQPAINAHSALSAHSDHATHSAHTYTTVNARTSTANTAAVVTAVSAHSAHAAHDNNHSAISAHSLSTNVAVDAHSLSVNVAVDAHTLSVNVGIDAHNTPDAPQPYYALAYIMKT